MTELSLIAKATVILGLALVLTRAARRAPASVRAFILAATFGLLLVQPIASALAPAREVQIPAAYAPPFLLEDEAAVGRPPDGVAASHSAAAGTPRSVPLPSAASLARGIWVLGAVVTLGPLLLGLRRSRTIRREAREWADGAVLASTLREAIGLRRSVSVVLHDDLVSPMTCGWRQPAIVMPADSPAWAVADVRQALLHELEHVRRHDWAVHILARFTCALYWFHPGAWLAWRQLALESERACDDAVVARAENAAYAEQLVILARRFGTTVSPTLLSMADRRTLATRVAAILNRNIPRGPIGAGCAAAIVIGAATLSAVISPLHAVVRGQAVQEPPAGQHAFEVASIRRNTSGQQGQTIALQGNTFVARNVTARELVMSAFRVRAEDLSGGPGWLDSERYDVLGRPQNEATWDEHLSMLQRLLADRFKLIIRRETRPSPVYDLVIARNGPRLTPAADLNCTAAAPGPKCGGFATRPGFFDGKRVTVAQVASLLSGRSGRLVMNRTGIEGFFDVRLSWTPDVSQLPVGPGPDDAPPFDPSGPSLFAAIQEQLGLGLEPATAEIVHLVIEQIERPTPNDAAPSLSFDIVSVKPNTGSDTSIPFVPVPPDGIHVVNRPLESLVRQAYDIQYFRVIDMPAWANQERFDITAKAARPITVEERRLMLRQLLADRFGVKVHFEPRETTVYVMTRARSDGALGPGLQRRPECPTASDKCVSAGSAIGPAGRLSLKAASLDLLASGLMSAVLEGLVVNESNVDGHFDVELSWRPDTVSPDAGDPRPSFITAVEEQLGMKLTPQKRSVQVLVIDQIRRPTAN